MQHLVIDLKKTPGIAFFISGKEPGAKIMAELTVVSVDEEKLIVELGNVGDGPLEGVGGYSENGVAGCEPDLYGKNVDVKTDQAVKKYTDKIVGFIKHSKFAGRVKVEYNEAHSTDETLRASLGVITTEHGVVNVFPNFNEKAAYACIVNLGLMQAMKKEGFEEGFILNEGKIYGTLTKYSKESVEQFGTYLTQKMDFSKN